MAKIKRINVPFFKHNGKWLPDTSVFNPHLECKTEEDTELTNLCVKLNNQFYAKPKMK